MNRWDEWPEEFFVKYWTQRWWRLVVRPGVDRAIGVGFDGSTGHFCSPTRRSRCAAPAAGTVGSWPGRWSTWSSTSTATRPGATLDLWVVPQNSPELRRFNGYVNAIDGLAMEELFYRATDRPCTPGWCRENLRNTRRIRDAGKFVLAVDYADRADHRRDACTRYAAEGFTGYVTDVELDRIRLACGPACG